jgi:hypothetical protein
MVKDLVKVVNTKVVHLEEVLDNVQRVVRVWFENLLIKGLEVGKILKRAQVTIITCERDLIFPLI